jgi:opacity protein-like surface antigen
MIKKSLGAALALAFMSSAVLASDLPSRAAAPAPVFTAAPAAVTGFYAGVRGSYATELEKGAVGANAGYEYGNLRFEGNYDRLGLGSTGVNLATGNVIYGYKLGNLTPYVLGGAGVAGKDGDFKLDVNHAVYNVGGGVRFAVTEKIELDGRYRFVQAIRKDGVTGERAYDHLFTAGVNYKF